MRRLGRDGPKVSVLGLGTNNFGWRIGVDESRAVLNAALDEGVTLLDTADVHDAGGSERILGELLAGRRDRVVLLTKFGNQMPDAPDAPRGSAAYARWALDGSLERLQTDHVDVWMLHRPAKTTPLAASIGAIADAIRAGKARYAGISNVTAEQVDEAAAAARAEGIPLVAVENRYSTITRDADADVVPACEHHGLALLPYYPLECGLLTGRYRRGEAAPGDSRFAHKAEIWPADRWLTDDAFDQVDALQRIADAHGASLLELAIGGLAALPAVGSVIAGATRPEQVRANAQAARWQPDAEALAALSTGREVGYASGVTRLVFGGNVRRTFCTLCPQHCGMLIEVANGKPVRFDGDRENPVAKGKLCIKGTACIEVHEHPDRLNHPLRRVGARGEGRWEPIGWEDALDEIAAKLADIRDREGPEALATLGGTHKGPGDWSSWRFACDFGTPNFVSQGRNCGVGEFVTETAVYGWDTIYQAPHPGLTKCVVIWGSNPAESSPPSWERLKQCQAEGAKLIVIDPRVTKTAARADLHLPVRPRTDGALALGLVHVIIAERLYDAEFVERWCNGFEEVAQEAAQWTPERTEEITGVPAHLIVEAARMYATNGPARIAFGVAPTQLGEGAARSALLGRAILRAISGNLDVPGGEPLGNPYDRENFAWLENVGFEKLIDHPLRTRESVNAHETPVASITGYRAFREAMAKVYPDGHTGMAYVLFASQPAIYRAVLDRDPYPVRAIIVQGGEPLLCMGGAKRAAEAFADPNLELLVAMDHWLTPTAQLADYVLPAADFLERPDISAHWGIGNFFVAGQKAVEPLHERHNDYELWSGLGRRLLDPADWPATLEEMLDRFLEPSGRTFEEWADGPINHNFPRPRWRKYEQTGFATRSGKVELVPTLLAELGVDPSPRYTGPPYAEPDADADAYPLQMIPGSRVRELTASNLRQSARLKRIHPEPLCDIHPATAAAHGIADGDWVAVERPEGEIRQKARLTNGIRADTVNPDGYWWEPGTAAGGPGLSGVWVSNANAITPSDPRLSSYAGDQPLRGARCRIRKADAPVPARVA